MRILQARTTTAAAGACLPRSRPRGAQRHQETVTRPGAPVPGKNVSIRAPGLRTFASSSGTGRDGFGATPDNPFASGRQMTPEEVMKRVEVLPS